MISDPSFCNRTLDYVFATSNLVVRSATAAPCPQQDEGDEMFPSELRNMIDSLNGPFPNYGWPSDHLLVEAIFTVDHSD